MLSFGVYGIASNIWEFLNSLTLGAKERLMAELQIAQKQYDLVKSGATNIVEERISPCEGLKSNMGCLGYH